MIDVAVSWNRRRGSIRRNAKPMNARPSVRHTKEDTVMFQQALDKVSKQHLIRPSYGNFIGGKFVEPVEGRYFDNLSPVTGAKLCQVARSSAADIELALDAAHKAQDAWGKTSVAERSNILIKIAEKMETNLELLAMVETLDNGKPIRETTYVDMPLSADHWRYF